MAHWLSSYPSVIDRPCTTCGYSLEKGTKIVAVADVISGCLLVPLWSILLSILLDHPPKGKFPESDKTNYDLGVGLLCCLIAFAVIQIIFGFILFYGQAKKNIPIIYLWLVISGISIPANGFLIKIYEMIVVQAYSDELKCTAQAEALEKFQELPYICVIKTQLYPGQTWGWVEIPEESGSGRKPGMVYYERNSFIINDTQNKAFDPTRQSI